MKQKKHISIVIFFVLLLFTSLIFFRNKSIDISHTKNNNPIWKSTSTIELYFLGLIRFGTLGKESEMIYNTKGQIIQQNIYIGKLCSEKIIYLYNDIDSLKKLLTLSGKGLLLSGIETFTYDRFKRHYQSNEYEVKNNKFKPDTTVTKKTNYFYDHFNNNIRTVTEYFEENYLPPDFIKPFLKSSAESILTRKFDAQHHVISDTSRLIDKDTGSKDEITVTNFTYDGRGFIKTKFSSDSIYYKTNKNGHIIEEKERYGDFVRMCNKYWYDEKGNKIKTFIDIDGGSTYEYVYDINNRLIEEHRPSIFLSTVQPIVKYDYEYYH